ncbi:high mobility group protein B4-like [Rattus rattus]|uniref:high mobility group protein B4-like n=1 Tax=Rattus rattus TaxID=10117 RepID=UPI0013F2EA5E|nr:high mobility group protein B4-like [Rattus rattus]
MDFRSQMREQQPNTYYDFTEFSRQCSEKWKTISKKEKKKYEALAKRDKDRYQREMRNYTGPRRERRRRDVNAPRKPPSSFLLFSQDHFDEIKFCLYRGTNANEKLHAREGEKKKDVNAPRSPILVPALPRDHFDEIKEQHELDCGRKWPRLQGGWARCRKRIKSRERAAVLRAKYLKEREAYYHQCQRRN